MRSPRESEGTGLRIQRSKAKGTLLGSGSGPSQRPKNLWNAAFDRLSACTAPLVEHRVILATSNLQPSPEATTCVALATVVVKGQGEQ